MEPLDSYRSGGSRKCKRQKHTATTEYQYLHPGLSFLYGTPTLVSRQRIKEHARDATCSDEGSNSHHDLTQRYTAIPCDGCDQDVLARHVVPAPLVVSTSAAENESVTSTCDQRRDRISAHWDRPTESVYNTAFDTQHSLVVNDESPVRSGFRPLGDASFDTRAIDDETHSEMGLAEFGVTTDNDQAMLSVDITEEPVGPLVDSTLSFNSTVGKKVGQDEVENISDPASKLSAASVASGNITHDRREVRKGHLTECEVADADPKPSSSHTIPDKPQTTTSPLGVSDGAELSELVQLAANYYDAEETRLSQKRRAGSPDTDEHATPEVAIDLLTMLPEMMKTKLVASLNVAVIPRLSVPSVLEPVGSDAIPAVIVYLYGRRGNGKNPIIMESFEPAAVMCLLTGRVLTLSKVDQPITANSNSIWQYIQRSKSGDWISLRSFLKGSTEKLTQARVSSGNDSVEDTANERIAPTDRVVLGWGVVNAGLGISIDPMKQVLQAHTSQMDGVEKIGLKATSKRTLYEDTNTHSGNKKSISEDNWQNLCLVVDSIAVPHWLEFNYTAPAVDLFAVNVDNSTSVNLGFSIHDQTMK